MKHTGRPTKPGWYWAKWLNGGTYTLFAGIVFLAIATLTTLATTLYADHPWLDGVWR